MTTEEKFDLTTVQATQVLTNDMLWKGVTFGGTVAASPLQCAGILRTTAGVGQGASAVYDGITKLKMGAAINTAGYPLTITTSGFGAAATSGSPSIGRSMTTCASGDLLKVLVDFKSLPFWSNA